jgi:hypothetical protein
MQRTLITFEVPACITAKNDSAFAAIVIPTAAAPGWLRL